MSMPGTNAQKLTFGIIGAVALGIYVWFTGSWQSKPRKSR